ncbi:histone H1-like, partial [Larimichthys crocea]|uniref:histone H1-like n=1 Tax=Larimichthys crocea TaxID=215358 RepID=UPI000F5E4CE6
MAEVAPAAPAAAPVAPAKAPKKKSTKPSKKTGPSTRDLILKAVSASQDRKGMSYVGLRKALAAGGYDVERKGVHVRRSVKSLLTAGQLVQTSGSGVSGSFKAAKVEKIKKAAKKSAVKATKSPAKKATVKKPKVKTTPKTKAATPKKKQSIKKVTKS